MFVKLMQIYNKEYFRYISHSCGSHANLFAQSSWKKGELIELMLLFNLLLVKYIYIGVAVAQEVQYSRSSINGLTSACQVSLTKILNAKLLPMLSSEC